MLAKRLEAGSFQLPPLDGDQAQVSIDGSTFASLTWAFERLGTHRDLFALPLEEMTPAVFKKALS